AGNETTRNATTQGMWTLVEHPDAHRRLVADPSALPRAIEEILRWTTPVIHFRRTAMQDVELRGKTIREGDKLALYYPSANRDEEIFDDPQTFKIDREPNDHLSFGIGQHFCLGANLARMELGAIFREVLARMPDLSLNGTPERLRSNFIHGVKRMPVRFTPERARARRRA
ncbi:MAG: cytochrome P450, partial [Myxococcales bacterium]|nr:cytochrome P450 [Myxococcales bacterium]